MTESQGNGVGARVRRNEDRRHLHGGGQYVADIRLPGMRDVSFVRSPIAHGRIRTVERPPGLAQDALFTAADLADITKPIVAVSGRPGFRASDYPILARDKVRFVGEPVALVIAQDRATAEDLGEQVFLDIEDLPAVVDWRRALAADAPRIHDDWPDNRFITYDVDLGDIEGARRSADLTITRDFDMSRTSGVPLECRGVVAAYDSRVDQLVIYSSTQWPHILRTKLAELIGIEERRLRVIAPDVGGGFGIKNNVYPEEVALGALALRLPFPLRWIEDRWEHMVGSAHARDHHYTITAHAASDGTLLGLEADIVVNAGAYSVWPWTAAMEAGMASGIIPGPYLLRNYRFTATTVATNTTPLGPYRGVARPGACFAIERTMDEIAHALDLEPYEVRLRNVVPSDRFPYESVTGMHYDSGDYPGMIREAVQVVGHDDVRQRQAEARATNRRIGLGYASYTEQTAHGVEEWDKRGLPVVFGFEAARVALDPSGTLTVDVGIQSHGQGLETTLAQVASEVLGIPPDRVTVRHGDTAVSPYGMGTFASRSMVMAGGATHRACEQLRTKICTIGAALLGVAEDEVDLVDEHVVHTDGRAVGLAEIADAAYLHLGRIPADIEPGLEVTYRYRPEVGTGTFSSSTHVAVVEVDVETGDVAILDYAVVEDCGRVVNPMIVDGQVHGGVAQGIGQALYEEARYDDDGQPRCTTFMDYLLPGSTEVPDIRVHHRETLSPFTVLGMKGMGEGGAIAPPAAIANAVTDALHDLGVAICWTPITPASVWLALQDALDGAESQAVGSET